MRVFHLLFIENSHIALSPSPPLNLTTLLPLPSTQGSRSHSCAQLIEDLSALLPNLTDMPIQNAEHTFFVDSSSIIGPDGQRWVTYPVVTLTDIVEAQSLPLGTTSQKAELMALTRALHLSEGMIVNIYTDSKYTFLIAHTHSAIWQDCSFLTTKGTPTINGSLIHKLIEAIQLPKQVAIIQGTPVP